jgi:hypothetical protein
MSKLLIPGDVAELEPVVDILKNHHDDKRAGTLAEIERRKGNGAPLDDETRWPALADKIEALTIAVKAKDTGKVREVSIAVLEATAGALVDPGDFKKPDGIDGVNVSLRILSAGKLRDLARAENRAFKRVKSLRDSNAADDDLYDAGDKVLACQLELLRFAVNELEVNGDKLTSVDGQLSDAALEVIERSGLLVPLYDAVHAFEDLPWGKGERSGSRALSTSSMNSTAAPAPNTATPSSGVTAAR